jgi:non-homologous end joining protein Ku
MAQKNVASIRISLMELLSTRGGLYSVRDNSSSRDTNLKMVCPSCKNSLLDQVYCCQAGCHPDANAPATRAEGWKVGEVGDDRVRVEGRGKTATLTVVSADEIEAANATTFEKGELALTVCPAPQVEAHTYPGGNIYCFVPEKPDKVYAMLLKAAADPAKAIIGILNMRGKENLYRLEAYQGTLRVVELLRPEETAVFDVLVTPPLDHKEQAMFDQLVEAVEEEFDADQYASGRLANLKQLLAEKAGTVAPITAAAPAAAKKPADTTDALSAALNAAKAAKAAKGKKVS